MSMDGYHTAKEMAFRIGQHLDRREFAKARGVLDDAILRLSTVRTIRDYQIPLSDVCTAARIVACWEEIGVETVEDFYRTRPRELRKAAEKNYSSKMDVADQGMIVQNRFSQRLHSQLLPEIIELLLAGDIINTYDVCHADPHRLRELVPDAAMLRDVALLQRKHR